MTTTDARAEATELVGAIRYRLTGGYDSAPDAAESALAYIRALLDEPVPTEDVREALYQTIEKAHVRAHDLADEPEFGGNPGDVIVDAILARFDVTPKATVHTKGARGMSEHEHRWIKCKGCKVWYCQSCHVEVEQNPHSTVQDHTNGGTS